VRAPAVWPLSCRSKLTFLWLIDDVFMTSSAATYQAQSQAVTTSTGNAVFIGKQIKSATELRERLPSSSLFS
jgi:hypothetical protein